MAFDTNVADQLSALTVAGAQHDQRSLSLIGESNVQGLNGVVTLGIQLTQMTALRAVTKIDPMEAAAAANIRSSQDPSHFAGLQAANRVPEGSAGAK